MSSVFDKIGFLRIDGRILRLTNLHLAERVLLGLVDGFNGASLRLSNKQLGDLLGLSDRQIKKHLRILRQQKLIRIEGGTRNRRILLERPLGNHSSLIESGIREPQFPSEGTTVPQSRPDKGTRVPTKEKRVNRKKQKGGRKRFVPPTLEQVRAYVEAKGYQVDPKRFVEYYTEAGWRDRDGRPLKNWKLKIITWSNHNGNHGRNETRSRDRDYAKQRSPYGSEISAVD